MGRVNVGFLDTVTINRKEQNKMKRFSTSGISCVSLENPEQVRKGRKNRGLEELKVKEG